MKEKETETSKNANPARRHRVHKEAVESRHAAGYSISKVTLRRPDASSLSDIFARFGRPSQHVLKVVTFDVSERMQRRRKV